MLLADGKTGAIRRFMVGPKECEVTGITWSPDRKTMFVGIQHPVSATPTLVISQVRHQSTPFQRDRH